MHIKHKQRFSSKGRDSGILRSAVSVPQFGFYAPFAVLGSSKSTVFSAVCILLFAACACAVSVPFFVRVTVSAKKSSLCLA